MLLATWHEGKVETISAAASACLSNTRIASEKIGQKIAA
jgi:hypothetical protein